MITHLHIENFKCFRDFDIDLDPFNVLIGDNDSGKTAFLMAIRLLAARAGEGPMPAGLGRHFVWRGADGQIVIRACARTSIESETGKEWTVWSSDGVGYSGSAPSDTGSGREEFRTCLGRTAYFRLNPVALRNPSPVAGKMSETGEGFPTYIDGILRADRDTFHEMENLFYRRFPYYRGLAIKVDGDPPRYEITLKTREGQKLPSEAVSDGVMLSLAFIAMSYAPDPPRVMLIEEPENGIHHASLRETIDTLKALSRDKGVQIILTTHSPYLLDQVEPEQVRVFYKDAEGAAHAFRLSDHPEVEKLKKHFQTGEIWTGLVQDEAEGFYRQLGAKP